jgi:hypothetical protein
MANLATHPMLHNVPEPEVPEKLVRVLLLLLLHLNRVTAGAMEHPLKERNVAHGVKCNWDHPAQ